MWRMIIAGSLCAMVQAALAQPGETLRTLTPEQAQEDLRILASLLHEAHPDPYRYTVKGELDRMVVDIHDNLLLPVTVADLRRSVMPIFHAIGDAGCQLEHPTVDPAAPVLPVEVAVLEGGVHVVDETKGFRSLPRGSRILSMNGEDMDAVLERISTHIVTDGRNETLRDAMAGPIFPGLYYNYVDPAPTFSILCSDIDKVQEEVRFMGLTQDEASRFEKPTGVDLAPWTSTVHPGQDALWLSLATLDMEELERSDLDPSRYLKALWKEMRRKGISNLVIDVRNTGGKELAMAEMIYSFIAMEPFRVVQDMSVRSLEPPVHYEHATPLPEYYDTVGSLFMPNGSGSNNVRPDDHRLEYIPPVKRTFTGKVHVVCNGGTRGAAAAFVMLAKRTRRARIVGEELGANAHSFTGGRSLDVQLPHSKLRFSIPLIRYVPEGLSTAPPDRGEMPHYTVVQRPEDLAKGRDTVKAALLELFNELQ